MIQKRGKEKKKNKTTSLRSVIEQDAVMKLKAVLVRGCKKHGYSQHRILGALYMMCLHPTSENNGIDAEWLKLLDSQVKRFDSLVDILLERVEAKKA